MPFIQRDNGAIVGIYANPQPGMAEEFLPDDNAEVIAFFQAPIDAENARLAREATVKADPGYADLLDKFSAMTPAQWQTYLTNNMTNLAEARVVVYRMGLVMMLLARRL